MAEKTWIDPLAVQKQQRIDLRPFITITGTDSTTFTPSEAGDRACDGDFIRSVRASVDWDAIPVMALSGDRPRLLIFPSTIPFSYYLCDQR